MISSKRLTHALLAGCASLALASCGGDSTAELANPGDTGQNPGVPGGGNPGTGNPGGGNGGNTGANRAAVLANCPTCTPVTVGTEEHYRLPSRFNANATLIAGVTYQMNTRVDVGTDTTVAGGGASATLTLLPGTLVYASDNNAYLVVNKGSRIVADGNVSQPIIFTSAADLDYDDDIGGTLTQRASYRGIATGDVNGAVRGEWGGIVINGLAPTNNPTRVGEGSTGTITGGTNAGDNSGVLRYVQVRYAGFDVGLATGGAVGQNELNGVAFQAVGNGTVVDFLQIHNAFDDAVEMFGGTVDIRHLVVTGTNDDAIDWTDGWTGRIQYALVVMNPNLPTGDGGIEADNLSGSEDRTPRSNPVISNLTIVGAQTNSLGGTALFRVGTAVRLLNTIVTNTDGPGLDFDNASTYAQISNGTTLLRALYISSTVALATDADDGPLPGFFNASGSNNATGASTMVAPVANGIRYINGTGENARPAFDARTIDSGFFAATSFIGAVQSTSSNWTLGWTEFLNRA